MGSLAVLIAKLAFSGVGFRGWHGKHDGYNQKQRLYDGDALGTLFESPNARPTFTRLQPRNQSPLPPHYLTAHVADHIYHLASGMIVHADLGMGPDLIRSDLI